MAQSIEELFPDQVGYAGEVPSAPAQSIGPPEDWRPSPGSLEEGIYGKHHNAWALLKSFESLVPGGKLLTESGRAELSAMSPGELALHFGVEAGAVALPFVGKFAARWAGTGLRSAYRKVFPTMTPQPLELMDSIRSSIKIPSFPSPSEVLRTKYGLSGPEILAYESDDLGYFFRRNGGTPSENLLNIFDKKTFDATGKARFSDAVRQDLKLAARPRATQELEWLSQKWQERVASIMQIPKGAFSEENHKRILRFMAKDSLGEDVAKTLDLESAPAELYGTLLKRMQDPPYQARLTKLAGAGAGTVLPTMIQPTRVIFGSGDELFGTGKIYELGKGAFESFRQAGFRAVTQLNVLFHEKGLGKLKARPTGEIQFKLGKEFHDAYNKAGPAISEYSRLIQSRAERAELDAFYGTLDDATRKFVDGYVQWSDDRYLEYLRGKLLQVSDETPFTSPGRSRYVDLLENDTDGVFKQLDEVFAPGADVGPYAKDLALEIQLDRVRRLSEALVNEKHIKLAGDDLDAFIKRLAWFDTKQNTGGLATYLDDFASVMFQKHGIKNTWIQKNLSTKGKGRFFVPGGEAAGQKITQEAEQVAIDLATLTETKARQLSLELFFYPVMDDVLKVAKAAPESYKAYTGHWIFRMLGKSTPTDAAVAGWMTKTYGGIERMLGLQSGGIWNAERVRNLSYNINNLIYMGGLGFKPFSAARNFFQPFLTVPTDLGGLKDYRWFFKGIARASDPALRTELKQMGLIAEYAPELHLQARATRTGIKLGSFQLPDIQQFRDTGMWMFQLSDRWSRYIAGGAAASKWDHFASKFMKDGVVDKEFFKRVNLAGRYDIVRKQVEDLLSTGGQANITKARELFIKDVVADTQYLYSQADSPLITNRFGGPGRLAVTFQSWWMNYATLLEKWVRTGDSGATKANRLFSFMLSGAVAEQLMEPLWGRGTASQTVGFGPFPGEFSEFMIPPTYAPFYRLLAGMISIGKMDLDAAERHGKGFLRSTMMFVPAGLQAHATIKGGIEEGWPGLAKSMIKYQKATDYEPLWGMLD